MKRNNPKNNKYHAIIVGAGPIGIYTALKLQSLDISCLIIEKGCIANSIYRFPKNMTFFSTANHLEVEGIPFISHSPRPTRYEALSYYRHIVQYFKLNICLYECVLDIQGTDGFFTISTNKNQYQAAKIIIATGFYDKPNFLAIEGENRPNVQHYFDEAHPYANLNNIVVGGGNSAVQVALELHKVGSKTTLIHRNSRFKPSVKYWLLPEINNRIFQKEIVALFNTVLKKIGPSKLEVCSENAIFSQLDYDFLFIMTGYQPNYSFLEKIGIECSKESHKKPIYHSNSLETNRKGIYLAGVICSGKKTGVLFIENTRIHAQIIADHIQSQTR